MQCTVNATVGREREYTIQKAPIAKRVVVVGGGPGGMEAARVAALRGHRVTLLERDSELGGQLRLAIIPPHKQSLAALTTFLTSQMKRLGVRLELGKEATIQDILALRPEAVVLATGSSPFLPELPRQNGADRSADPRPCPTVLATEVLAGRAQVGERVVVLGGELVGCETAEFLAGKGHKVTITRRGPQMALKVRESLRELLLGRLQFLGVEMLTGVQYEAIRPQGLAIVHQGQHRLLPADTIVVAAGAQSNRGLLPGLEGHCPVYCVGDCISPRGILEAIHEGAKIGRLI